MKRNITKRNETKRYKTEQNKTKWNKTKRNDVMEFNVSMILFQSQFFLLIYKAFLCFQPIFKYIVCPKSEAAYNPPFRMQDSVFLELIP